MRATGRNRQVADWTFAPGPARKWTGRCASDFTDGPGARWEGPYLDPLTKKDPNMPTTNRSPVTTVAFVGAATLVIIAVLLHDVGSVLLLAGAFWLVKVGLDT
ncbi:hypothetical protein GCM10029964_012300 [Kibdelosporangium lantanae]